MGLLASKSSEMMRKMSWFSSLKNRSTLLEEHPPPRADDSGVDDHRAQHRGLGGEIVRGHAVDEVGVGLGAGECGTDAGAGGGRQGGHGGIQSMEKGAL